jgi:NAD(P)-dependent dehydrogenase (short-subunit alcohol dehydrogenase family)
MTGNEGPTRGHVIVMAEPAGVEALSGEMLPYLTAQASIAFMTRAFALELAAWGILVNSIVAPASSLDDDATAEELAELVLTLLRLETVTGEEVRAGEFARARPEL